MNLIKTSTLTKTQKDQVLNLWNNEYPQKLKHENIESFNRYLKELSEPNHILLIDETGLVVGWYFDFIRENEKWFAMILNSTQQGKGYGTKLLQEAKLSAKELNGWVIDHNEDKKLNGQFYKSPISFYIKNGFNIINDTRLELEKISAVKINWKSS